MGDNKKKYIKWTVIIIALIAILVPIFMNIDKWIHFLSDPNQIKELVLSYGHYSTLVFVILQILQIIIFFIPGEVVQFAGGYIFGPYLSFLLCIIGVVIGSAITFSISRKFGKPLLEKIVHKDSLWIVRKLEDAKHHREEKHPNKKKKRHPKTIIFILYMIPGIPKDILGYISGIADISLKEFLIVSTIARSPALFVSCFFGDKLEVIKDKILSESLGFNAMLIIGVIVAIAGIFFLGRKLIQKMKEED